MITLQFLVYWVCIWKQTIPFHKEGKETSKHKSLTSLRSLKKPWKWHGQKYLVQVYSLLCFLFIIRAYELWTEEFLISEYGDLTVRLEARAEANDRLPVGKADILGRDTIKHFIQNYQTMDAYVISQIPQPMERDIGIPPCLRLNL